MAIFEINKGNAKSIKLSDFKVEKELQTLIEGNLTTIFNCKFIASEFPTGDLHGGRIDTLAISEDNNPVIIEYKKVASSELLNQSLFYLHWIIDHKGDYQVAANKSLGKNVDIDWSAIRVICIAPEYKKYDLHAAQVMGVNIELWQYKIYENGILNLDEILRRSETLTHVENINQEGKNPVMVTAGKKAAETRRTGVYTIEEHLEKLSAVLRPLFSEIRDYVTNLDSTIEETPKKYYVAYKTTKNFLCIELQRNQIVLFLKINAADIKPLPIQARDVKNIGHFGTGDLEVTIKTAADFEQTKYLIDMSLKNIGG
jgi:predicted transport protein